MKKLAFIILLILFCQLIWHAQAVFELNPNQSMLISGKGIGQDASINPFEGEDCFAIVKNIGDEIFTVRVQQKGKVIELVSLKGKEIAKVKFLIGYELYLDTRTRKKAKASIEYERISRD